MLSYRKLVEADLKELSELVWTVFSEFVAPYYSQEGIINYKKFIDPEHLKDNFNSRNMEFYGCFEEEKIVGVIAVRQINHICLFFIDKNYHGQGIAKKLFALVKNNIVNNNNTKKYITVNSSPYAVKIYERLGFNAIDEEQVKDGIRFTPMKYIF